MVQVEGRNHTVRNVTRYCFLRACDHDRGLVHPARRLEGQTIRAKSTGALSPAHPLLCGRSVGNAKSLCPGNALRDRPGPSKTDTRPGAGFARAQPPSDGAAGLTPADQGNATPPAAAT